VQLGTTKTTLQLLELAFEVAANGNIYAMDDARSGASLANSAIFASGLNVNVMLEALAIVMPPVILGHTLARLKHGQRSCSGKW
jgi:hypothetical protein